MKRFLIFALCMSGVFFIGESTAQTLTESLKKKAAMYLTDIYESDSSDPVKADDLNTRYWIYDILDQKNLTGNKAKPKTGRYISLDCSETTCAVHMHLLKTIKFR